MYKRNRDCVLSFCYLIRLLIMERDISSCRRLLNQELKGDDLSATQTRSRQSQTSAASLSIERSTTKRKEEKRADPQQLTVFRPSQNYDISKWIELVNAKTPQLLHKEYHTVCTKTAEDTKPYTYAAFTANKKKNRYGDITVFDKTRVSLDDQGAYINASFVVNSVGKRYICAQAPTRSTCTDFWHMIWKEKVIVIAMLCSTVEEGKTKCLQYWPNSANGVLQLEKIKIQNLKSKEDNKITRSLMQLTHVSGENRLIYHIEFHHWPDRGMPESENAICQFIEYMKQSRVELGRTCRSRLSPAAGAAKQNKQSFNAAFAPDLLHCSAGVGRTGTLCCILICIDYLESSKPRRIADIKDVLKHVRRQRNRAVQTLGQYLFVYSTVLEYLKQQDWVPEHTVDKLHFRSKAKKALTLSSHSQS